jgi:hypothetical protein
MLDVFEVLPAPPDKPVEPIVFTGFGWGKIDALGAGIEGSEGGLAEFGPGINVTLLGELLEVPLGFAPNKGAGELEFLAKGGNELVPRPTVPVDIELFEGLLGEPCPGMETNGKLVAPGDLSPAFLSGFCQRDTYTP